MRRDPRELGSSWTRYQEHAYPTPSPDLAHCVERYWVVSWRYDAPYRQLIVPYPNVHLTFRDGVARVQGVSSRHQIRVLEGRSSVFGVAFRPGCFRPFLRRAVSTITDRSIDARRVFDARLLPEHAEMATVEDLLRSSLPAPDPTAEQAAGIVAKIAATPHVTKVADLATEVGVSVRQLQRLFAEYIGIGPKWVIRRYRLYEVTDRLADGAEIDWATLAADLGYADQAHFVRDFKKLFGEPPTWYAERY